jgi:hypothetical protein
MSLTRHSVMYPHYSLIHNSSTTLTKSLGGPLTTLDKLTASIVLPLAEYHINGNAQHGAFLHYLLSFSLMHTTFIHGL